MSPNVLIPIRFHKDILEKDWPMMPKSVQDAMAGFLMKLQRDPADPEIASKSRRDPSDRLAYEFSPGYDIYWKLAREDYGQPGLHWRIDVLAVVSPEIKLSPGAGASGPIGTPARTGEGNLLTRVYSRTAALGNLAMWGTLFKSAQTGRLQGWMVDSWSQGDWPPLNPKMHWVSFPDSKLHHMALQVDFSSTMQVGPEDAEVEPQRLIFVRSTLAQWEKDWLEQESKSW